MIYNGLKSIFGERYKENVPLAGHTSFRTGGEAQVMVLVSDEESFVRGMRHVIENSIPYYVFGNCSNVLISDRGLRGAVFLITKEFGAHSVDGFCVEAQAGILLSRLSEIAYENSLSGLEFASGIPGTLGAAIAINAGAYGGQMSDVVTETRYLDRCAVVRTIATEGHDFSYRHSIFCDNGSYVLSSKMKLKRGNRDAIGALIREYSARRREKQPLTLPSAGSVFKRPQGDFAGRLIQEAGLMGTRIGGAEVSAMHAGFIVNTGGATSKDIYRLICLVREEVVKKTGIELEIEIKILGDFDY